MRRCCKLNINPGAVTWHLRVVSATSQLHDVATVSPLPISLDFSRFNCVSHLSNSLLAVVASDVVEAWLVSVLLVPVAAV